MPPPGMIKKGMKRGVRRALSDTTCVARLLHGTEAAPDGNRHEGETHQGMIDVEDILSFFRKPLNDDIDPHVLICFDERADAEKRAPDDQPDSRLVRPVKRPVEHVPGRDAVHGKDEGYGQKKTGDPVLRGVPDRDCFPEETRDGACCVTAVSIRSTSSRIYFLRSFSTACWVSLTRSGPIMGVNSLYTACSAFSQSASSAGV